MGLDIDTLRIPRQGPMYIAPERICVTADGELCDEDDVRAVRLLVAKGGEIPAAEAAQYGLIAEDDAEAVDATPAAPAASAPDTSPAASSTEGTGDQPSAAEGTANAVAQPNGEAGDGEAKASKAPRRRSAK